MIFIKERKYYQTSVLTEYMTREQLLLPSFIPSILLSSSCLPIPSSSSSPSNLFSLCFSFSLPPYTFVNSLSDSSHEICSLLELSPFISVSCSKATVILWMFFLSPCNSPKSFNFLKTSVFHSASICCLVFLALDLWIVSTLAFACTLSASKDLQAALALVQGVQDVM